MREKLLGKLKSLSREQLIILVATLFAVIATLWALSSGTSSTRPTKEEGEVGLVVPKDFVVMPLELKNGQALSTLISTTAVVDLYQAGEKHAFIENLKIFKLDAGEGPLFGALVPEAMSGQVSEIFSRPSLMAALRKASSSPTRLRQRTQLARPVLVTVPIEEDSL